MPRPGVRWFWTGLTQGQDGGLGLASVPWRHVLGSRWDFDGGPDRTQSWDWTRPALLAWPPELCELGPWFLHL